MKAVGNAQSQRRLPGQLGPSAGAALVAVALGCLMLTRSATAGGGTLGATIGQVPVTAELVAGQAGSRGQEPGDEEEVELPPPVRFKPHDLLKMRPFDRVILRETGQIVDIMPLETRPLPKPWPRRLIVELYNGEGREYVLDMTQVERIKYFEDLLLEQGDNFLKRRMFENAWDFYSRVVQLNSKWPGLQKRLQDFLFQEAEYLLSRQQLERALNDLHELARLNPDYPDLRNVYGRAMDYAMNQAWDRKDYRRLRLLIRTLEESYPDHEVAQRWSDRLSSQARQLLDESRLARQQNRLREAYWRAYEAVRLWPALEGLREYFEDVARKYPVLFVGVRDVAEDFNPWASPGTSDARVAQLLHTPLLRVADVGEKTRFEVTIAEWELGELGREIRFRLRDGLRWSDGKPITAIDLARSIGVRIDRRLPSYDAALASNYAGMRVHNLSEFSVYLRRTVLRPEVFFLFPLVPGHQLEFAIRPGRRSPDELPIGSGPYYAYAHTFQQQTNIVANPNYYIEGRPLIREIVEREFERSRLAVDALLRGEVDFVENVHPVQVLRLREQEADRGIKLRKRRVTALHVLSFDFRKPELRSRELRRAIAYAINREAILRKALLNGKDYLDAWVAAGPFPRDSYAYERSLRPWPFKPSTARALVEVVRATRGALPAFQLMYPGTDEAREAVKYIERYLETVGLDIIPVERSAVEIERQVRAGQPFDIAYRVFYIRDPVFDAASVLCPGQLIAPDGQVLPNCSSDWLRHLLTRLSLTTNWREAIELLRRIQLDAHDDVAVLPLWEFYEYDAYRPGVTNVPEDPLWTYDEVINWQVEPYYPKE